jgi:class III poly(R)-hydroxyalkanoic acid synthase PhaE subunit
MTDAGAFTNDWMELQRKYWEGWTALGRQAGNTEAALTNPWEAALDHWWKAVSPGAPDLSRDFMTKIMDQGKSFFAMADSFTKNMAGMPGPGSAGTDGWGALTKTLEDMQKAFTSGFQQDGDEASRRIAGFWEMPYDNWQRMMSSMSLMPGDVLRNMPHNKVKEGLNQALSAPGLGYTREEQSQYQDLMRRGIEYQKALQDYLHFFSDLGAKSVARMRSFIESRDKPIDSARALYDSWVTCCEEVYAEEVKTPDYARVSAQLVNAQMAVKQRMAIMVDEALGGMNMPTRSELRTLQDRLQETRREYKALRREVEALKRELGTAAPRPALVNVSSQAAAPKAAVAPAVTPKPATPRRAPVARKTTPKAPAKK